MNLLKRIFALIQANHTATTEKSEDPETTLQQLQLDMHAQLVQVKTQVATSITEGMKLQKRQKENLAEANEWLEKAKLAVQSDNEKAARDFLSRYNDLTRQARRYQQQQQTQEQLVATMRDVLRQLEEKISEVDTTIELLASRKRNALIQQRFYEALDKINAPARKQRTSQAQDKLLEMEARAGAMAELQRRDLDFQITQISQEEESGGGSATALPPPLS